MEYSSLLLGMKLLLELDFDTWSADVLTLTTFQPSGLSTKNKGCHLLSDSHLGLSIFLLEDKTLNVQYQSSKLVSCDKSTRLSNDLSPTTYCLLIFNFLLQSYNLTIQYDNPMTNKISLTTGYNFSTWCNSNNLFTDVYRNT